MNRKAYSEARLRGRRAVARRARWLETNPLCVHCAKSGKIRQAVTPDHIIALANGGSDTEDNLQSLCAECHRVKTAKDLGYTERTQIGRDGWPVK